MCVANGDGSDGDSGPAMLVQTQVKEMKGAHVARAARVALSAARVARAVKVAKSAGRAWRCKGEVGPTELDRGERQSWPSSPQSLSSTASFRRLLVFFALADFTSGSGGEGGAGGAAAVEFESGRLQDKVKAAFTRSAFSHRCEAAEKSLMPCTCCREALLIFRFVLSVV